MLLEQMEMHERRGLLQQLKPQRTFGHSAQVGTVGSALPLVYMSRDDKPTARRGTSQDKRVTARIGHPIDLPHTGQTE